MDSTASATLPPPVSPIEPDDQAPLARQVITGLERVAGVLRQHAWRDAGPRGLTPTQARIIALLGRRAPRRLADLADALGVSRPTAGDAVATLVGKGLVAKGPDPDDGRAVALGLTARGRAVSAATAGWPASLADAAAELPAREQATLLKALVRMSWTLQQAGEVPGAAICPSCRFFRPRMHAAPDTPHHCMAVDRPFGDRALRLDCPAHRPAAAEQQQAAWQRFAGSPVGTGRSDVTPGADGPAPLP